MPHERLRHVYELLKKKIATSRVVIVNGARQVGKSFLVRELLVKKQKKILFLNLDDQELRSFANENPKSFLEQKQNDELLAIDEAQRAPSLFEAIKQKIDTSRRPRQFLLLGSTEFSHRSQIRESLTGRATRVQLYTFNLAETKKAA